MERNLDRKTLSFGRGMTNVPSDLLSDDTELTESIGFQFRNGEMKPIQNPELIGLVPYTIMYVHKSADYANLIAYDDKDTIHWYKLDGKTISAEKGAFKVGTVYDIKSVGNTLIVATTQGLHYILYKGSTYKDLGKELPKPTFEPSFPTRSQAYVDNNIAACYLDQIIESQKYYVTYDSNGNISNIFESANGLDQFKYEAYYRYKSVDTVEKRGAFQDAAQGHAAAVISKIKSKNYFLFPFFVRFALKLFDGSYARISEPIACYPTNDRNCYFVPVTFKNERYNETSDETKTFMMYPMYSKMWFSATIEGKEDWDDIVKELVVFASDDVMPFNITEEWSFKRATDVNGEAYANFPGSRNLKDQTGLFTIPDLKFHFNKDSYKARDVLMPKYKTDSEIIKELVTKSQFYKLFSVKISSSYIGGTSNEAPIDAHVVENLTTQEQLGVDDYYGWTHIVGKKMFPYNKRINLFDVLRYPFMGFNKFDDSPTLQTTNYQFTYYVHVVSGIMDTWVKSEETSKELGDYADAWFYYPDPNATEVVIWDSKSNKGMKLRLEKHPLLNGAYSFNKLPIEDTFVADDSVAIPTVDTTAHEVLDSQIFTSVVNNPFVFEASGDNTIGTGKIFGIMANTDAVSQGQFGQYPLMVFTSEGIYGLSVNSEGLYSASYPISRDVCNEDSPLVPTDKLIFFASEKGLMATSGNTVACMSEQMKGGVPRNFVTLGDGDFRSFLKGCLIAYDYRDSNIILFGKDKTYQYIYNMEDKVFSMLDSGINAKTIINNYPDNLIQGIDGNIYSLTNKPDIIADSKDYYGSFTTRPLKLGGSITLKSLRAIKHLADTDKGSVRLSVYGGNDCKHWQRITSVGGKPWKYFTLRYDLVGFKAYDSYSGSIVEIQNRRQDKIR